MGLTRAITPPADVVKSYHSIGKIINMFLDHHMTFLVNGIKYQNTLHENMVLSRYKYTYLGKHQNILDTTHYARVQG